MTHNLWSLYKQHHVQSCCQQEKLQQNQINQPWSLFWSIFFPLGINRFTFEVPAFFFWHTVFVQMSRCGSYHSQCQCGERLIIYSFCVTVCLNQIQAAWNHPLAVISLKMLICTCRCTKWKLVLFCSSEILLVCCWIYWDFLPGIKHLFFKERKLLTIFFAKAEV